MAESGIYEIRNLVNGKRYVGSAVDIAKRWREHRKHLKGGRHHSRHLQAAWAKYGDESFAFRILLHCSRPDLLSEEQKELDKAPEYNACRDARSTIGVRHSAETKRKISESQAGRKMPPRDEDYRAKISAALKGRSKSPEQQAALQAGRKAFKRSEDECRAVSEALRRAYAEGRKSRERPPEYRAKIAETLRGRKATAEHRANQSAAQLGKKRGPYKRRAAE
jgi:group I intron endonuclease